MPIDIAFRHLIRIAVSLYHINIAHIKRVADVLNRKVFFFRERVVLLCAIRGYGETGIRARFRFWWEAVRVRVPLAAYGAFRLCGV